MDLSNCKQLRIFGVHLNFLAAKCMVLVVIALFLGTVLLPTFSGIGGVIQQNNFVSIRNRSFPSNRPLKQKFLEVPQIVWGLNNQKIAFARACLTARMLNRTLLMPKLSASLFYKEVELLKPISFDKIFQFERFNSLCKGFVQLSRYSDVSNQSDVIELQKGSGRRWKLEKDLEQLNQFSKHPYDTREIVRIVGKNPFLWHDHWPAEDYAKVFECLALVDEISMEADKVVSKIREIGMEVRSKNPMSSSSSQPVPFVGVHMRIEKDWMIHCKKLEQRLNINEICSSKEEIMARVGNIAGLKTPVVVYLAVADTLLEDDSVLNGWKDGLHPFEKKKLGVFDIYKKQPYLFQSAIDYEVCLRSDIFIGNSFSTFSSLVVLDRTQKMIKAGETKLCGPDVRWPSYAYNIRGAGNSPHPWVTNMSDTSLTAISYGSNHISC
ncbi:O-fucosyltransferase 23 [Datura stramonium]|uniref:O-fucosyltransferase family protein n=1 Tax=Datura stramonium TaxID=4076 RepID=A0ABS8VE48_DATST|nr:O-fucosyltransferase 23 [Datura stramonium]